MRYSSFNNILVVVGVVVVVVSIVICCTPVKSTRQNHTGSTDKIVCMSQQDISACNTFGTDLSSIVSSQDDPRCSEISKQQEAAAAGVSDSPGRAKQCPCKANYFGAKCDSCSDGFYMRFQHFRETDQAPPRSRDDNKLRPATIYHRPEMSAAAHRRAHRSFSCQWCNCDPMGSKSINCDKRNGTCFCIDGYTGQKCDKCSLGYFNASANLPFTQQADPLNQWNRHRPRQCVECGECFNQWHVRAIELKDTSVEIIKRAFELTSGISSSSSSGFSMMMMEPAEVDYSSLDRSTLNDRNGSLFDRWGNFDELDEKFSLVSKRVFTNKQNSDKLNLLASEIQTLATDYNRTASSVTELGRMNGNIETRITRSNYYLKFVSSLVNDRLNRLVNKFEQDQISAQEDLPRGAHRLIQMYSNLSLATRESSIKFQQESRPQLDALSEKLDTQLASLNSSHLILQELGQKMLKDSLKLNQLDDVSHLSKFLSQRSVQNNSEKKNQHHRPVQSIILAMLHQDLESKVQSHLSERSTNEENLEKLAASMLEVLKIVDGVDSSLNQFHFKWLSVLTLNSSSDIRDIEPWTIYAALENSSKSLRASSDRVEARFKQLEIAAGNITNSEVVAFHKKDIQMIQNLTLEINTILANKLSSIWSEFELAHKGELLQLNSLKKRSNLLFHDSSSMKKNVTLVNELNQETNHLQELTRFLVDKTNQDMASLSESLQADSVNLDDVGGAARSQGFNSDRSPTISALRQKYLETRTNIIERDLIHSHQAAKIKRHIENATTDNENLLGELARDSLELSNLLNLARNGRAATTISVDNSTAMATPSTIEKNESRLPIEKELKLSHRLRAQKLADGIEQLVRDLVTMVSKTNGLKEELSSNERILRNQNKTLHLLQDEVDTLTTELESGLVNCGSSQCRPP